MVWNILKPANTDLLNGSDQMIRDNWAALQLGWLDTNDAWSYASASTITVPTNATTKYSVGMKVKITQVTGGTKYFYITVVAATLLTLVPATAGVVVNNEAISTPCFSTARQPFGYPDERIILGAGMSDHITITTYHNSGITAGTWGMVIDSGMANNHFFWNSSGTQNDRVDYLVSFSGGTYTFAEMGYRDTNRAIMTLLIDGVSVGTIDQYSASTKNVAGSITGIAITAGSHTVSIKAATRNGSSGGWYLAYASLGFWRTA